MVMETLSWLGLLVFMCCLGQGHLQCTSKRKFQKNDLFANRVLSNASLWTKSGGGGLACSRECVRDSVCASFFYNRHRDVCTALSLHLHSLEGSVEDEGSSYYTLDPADCGEILRGRPDSTDGVYLINPTDNGPPVKVYCDMTSDGGGWTVFQRRNDSTDGGFNRRWVRYKKGFGSKGTFWLGNDLLHRLTKIQNTQLRIDMLDYNNQSGFATYSTFKVGDETTKYSLTVAGFNGNRGDSLQYHDGMKFSTRDQDNDNSNDDCVERYFGGWWYNNCSTANLNGRYGKARTNGIFWTTWNSNSNVQWTEMKFRYTERKN